MQHKESDIAVVGMAGRFPGADNIETFWHNIQHGVESIRTLSDEEILASGVSLDELSQENYVKAKGVLDGAETFDARFFGFTKAEATHMDPQQRVLLEVAYHALEDAGCHPDIYSGSIGTFVSAGFNTYLLHCLENDPSLQHESRRYQTVLLNSNDFPATRIAYCMNLTGPAQTIQTACSSSLVAIHHACQSLINYECDTALAGGACITTPLRAGYTYKRESIASPDGHCRPFDAEACGTVPGNGVGIVVLKRLENAISDQDTIYAIVKGSAVNNDGNKKMSYTAPSVQGQAEVIRMAHGIAEVESESIQYIEAHGTGTLLGDPIEIQGLRQGMEVMDTHDKRCFIGSVKANIGHLDSAAGVTGFIKTVLMLHHKVLPPQINYDTANPKLNLDHSPFEINTQCKEWGVHDTPRRAAVSSFGIGGTNAHIVLEEMSSAVSFGEPMDEERWHVMPVSARSPEGLESLTSSIVDCLQERSHLFLRDVAYTIQKRRRPYDHRVLLCARRVGGVLEYNQINSGEVYEEGNIATDIAEMPSIHRWLAGESPAWERHSLEARVVSLPAYPFQRERYWISASHVLSKQPTPRLVISNKGGAHQKETEVAGIIEDIIGECPANHHASFEELGIDSFASLELIMMLEKAYGVSVSMEDCMQHHNTIEKMTSFLAAQPSNTCSKPPISPLVVELKSGDEVLPNLFCIHPAGGVITPFQEIISHIETPNKILGIRASGLYGDESIHSSIADMAEEYADIVLEIQTKGPYLLCGSSLGGAIALEVSRILQAKGKRVTLLAMIDTPASTEGTIRKTMPTKKDEVLAYVKELSPAMATSLERMADGHSNTIKRFCNVWAKHAQAMQAYKPCKYNGRIIYFSAAEQTRFMPHYLVFGWMSIIQGGIEIHEVAGNHLTMHEASGALKIANVLQNEIWKACSLDIATDEDLELSTRIPA